MVLSVVFLCLAFGAFGMLLFVAIGGFSSTTLEELSATTSYALVDCAPPPSSAAGNSSDFRESLLPLLAALPVAAAAAPLRFASLQSDDDRAFVRGLCLAYPAEKDCLACLAAAAENLTASCLGASRRAGAWRGKGRRAKAWRGEGCFLAYADANTSSAREDAFHEVVFGGGDPGEDPNCFDPRRLVALARSMGRSEDATTIGAAVFMDAADLARRATTEHTVRVFPDVARSKTTVCVQAQCPRDTAAAECARCLADSARKVPPCSWGLDGAHARVADVVSYGCFLRIETSVPLSPRPAATWLSENKPSRYWIMRTGADRLPRGSSHLVSFWSLAE